MATEIRVPTLGESVTEATIAQWFKKAGEAVAADEPLVELETDKVTVEVPAPAAGVLSDIAVKDGETVEVGALLGAITEGAGAPRPSGSPRPNRARGSRRAGAEPAPRRRRRSAAVARGAQAGDENKLDPSQIAGTGKDGRILKGDVLAALETGASAPARASAGPGARAVGAGRCLARRTGAHDAPAPDHRAAPQGRPEHRGHADHLQRGGHDQRHGAAQPVQGPVREEARRQARLHGLLRQGLRRGAEGHSGGQRGDRRRRTGLQELLPCRRRGRHRQGPGGAGGARGGQLSLAGIEKTINDFGRRARDGQLKIDEMQGGTFTISNGGVYGSLMSTPILNAPQSGILGMHKIQQRPMAVDGEIKIRPMMYLALSYDHRIVDGKEAVTFLVRVKENAGGPATAGPRSLERSCGGRHLLTAAPMRMRSGGPRLGGECYFEEAKGHG